MEMVRLSAGSVAQLALDETRSYQFTTMAFMRLCAGNQVYKVHFRIERRSLTNHKHKFVCTECRRPLEDHTAYHMHEPCITVRARY